MGGMVVTLTGRVPNRTLPRFWPIISDTEVISHIKFTYQNDNFDIGNRQGILVLPIHKIPLKVGSFF